MMNKIVSNVSLKCFYTNADQFVNKRDDLLTMISDDRPDLILITEVIPKKQVKTITDQLLDNFDPNKSTFRNSWCCHLRERNLEGNRSQNIKNIMVING